MTALLWKLSSLFVEILLEQFQLIELVILKLHAVITGQISPTVMTDISENHTVHAVMVMVKLCND